MSATREGRLRFLVATDVAARGIDISHLTHVINYDFPETRPNNTSTAPGGRGACRTNRHGHRARGPEGYREPLPPAAHVQDSAHREAASERGRDEDTRGDGSPAALRGCVRGAARCTRTTSRWLGASSHTPTPSDRGRACSAITSAHAADDARAEAAEARRARNPPPQAPPPESRAHRAEKKRPLPPRGRPNKGRARARRISPQRAGAAPRASPRTSTRRAGRVVHASGSRPRSPTTSGRSSSIRTMAASLPRFTVEGESPARGDRGPAKRTAPAASDREDISSGFVQLFVNVGKREGVRPRDLQKPLADKGISDVDAGRIRVRDRMSFIDVKKEAFERAVAALSGSGLRRSHGGRRARARAHLSGPDAAYLRAIRTSLAIADAPTIETRLGRRVSCGTHGHAFGPRDPRHPGDAVDASRR